MHVVGLGASSPSPPFVPPLPSQSMSGMMFHQVGSPGAALHLGGGHGAVPAHHAREYHATTAVSPPLGTPARAASVSSLQFHPKPRAGPSGGRGGVRGGGKKDAPREGPAVADAAARSKPDGPSFGGATQLSNGGSAAAAAAAASEAAAQAPPGEANGGRVSHGASEKQRRDRINAMVDILRGLVPGGTTERGPPAASAASAGGAGIDARRSKFVVLQEAIHLIQWQRQRIEALETRIARGNGGGGGGGERLRADADANVANVANGTAAREGPASSPVSGGVGVVGSEPPRDASGPAAGGAGSDVSVGVQMGAEKCYVQVRARDRRGLLQDILRAIGRLPMTVTRANCVPARDPATGVVWVTDVFELSLTPGAPRVTGEQARERIARSLAELQAEYEHPTEYAGVKKRRHPEEKMDRGGGLAGAEATRVPGVEDAAEGPPRNASEGEGEGKGEDARGA